MNRMLEFTLDSTVTASDPVVSRQVANEIVLLNMETGAYYGLDPVGARMWELLSQGNTVRQVVDTLTPEYDVEAQQLEYDLLEFLARLGAKGLIETGR